MDEGRMKGGVKDGAKRNFVLTLNGIYCIILGVR